MVDSDLSIKRVNEPQRVVLVLDGSVDSVTYQQLQQEITACFEEGVKAVGLDLSGVRTMTSSGAGVLINACGEANSFEAALILIKISSNVRNVLDMLGLLSLFQIED